MKVESTELDGVLLIKPSVFEDHRGLYVETYNKDLYKDHGIDIDFIQDDYSVSRRNVLRGLHGDRKTWKLVSCSYGEYYLIVMNNNNKSNQYKKWTSFIVSAQNRNQVLIPPNFANGHLILTESAVFNYKQSENYDRKSQFTIKWNDPKYKIWWPINDPVLSMRDSLI